MCNQIEKIGRKHSLYNTWASIKTRTTNPNCKSFRLYGGKGVTMCNEWAESFSRFVSDMGPKPSPAHTVDRIDGRLGYTPTNCRWATTAEQARNQASNILVEYGGRRVILTDFAAIVGVNYFSLYHRMIQKNQSPQEAAAALVTFRDRNTKCTIEGCGGALFAKGLCNMHYQRSRRVVKDIRADNTSGFRGVSFHKLTGRWSARVEKDKVRTNLGLFDSAESAAVAIADWKSQQPNYIANDEVPDWLEEDD